MRIFTVGTALIDHEEGGEQYEIEATELEWVLISSDDEPMGARTVYEATVEHRQLGTLTWALWEYPEGSEENRETNIGKHQLVHDFDFGFEQEPDDDEEKPLDRYYSEIDQEVGITDATLRRLSSENQVPYLTWWFRGRYVDPVEETSYNGREGGYLWNHGGPYDAREELETEFGRLANERAIEIAVEEIESDGILEWAAGDDHPDRADERYDYLEPPAEDQDEITLVLGLIEGGVEPVFGTEQEQALRVEVLKDLGELEIHLPPAQGEHGGFGHNNPPAEQQFTATELAELREAVTTIREQMAKPAPDVKAVAEKTGWLRKFGKWFRSKLDVSVDTAIEHGTTAAIAVAAANMPAIVSWLAKAAESLVSWLGSVMPF